MALFQKRKGKLEQVNPVLEQYVRFCSNPLRNTEVVRTEFAELCAVPGVNQIAFYDAHTLILGTEHIILPDPTTKKLHDVGEFLIFIRRFYVNPTWDVSFRFRNITRDLYDGSGYMHPHIVWNTFDEIEVPTGGLCIQRGKYDIYQFIRRGEIHLVAPLLIDVLKTYNPSGPYHELDNWPEYQGDV